MTTLLELPTDDEAAVRPAGAPLTWLEFQLGKQSYALPIGDIQEIVPMARLSQFPGAPVVLAGMLEIAGQPIPVVDLSRLFELPATTLGIYTPILILRNCDHPLALLVEKVSRMISLPEEAILAIRDNPSFNGCATGIANIAGETILLLSSERILLEKERSCLAAWEIRTRERLDALEEVET